MGIINVSLPNDGETADVSDYNTPINTIVTEVNGNLDNTNIKANAAISGAKLADASVTNAKLATGTTLLGYGTNAGTTLTASYVAAQSVTATSTGKDVLVRVGGYIENANSGANRTYNFKLVVDGADVQTLTGMDLAQVASSNNGHWYSYTFKHTPTAASHTWALHLQGSTAGAIITSHQYMEVAEVV